MWPVLSDINPNGLVLSRGIEESHVNCLFFAKPFADIIVFTDIDDMLLSPNPMDVGPGTNVAILQVCFCIRRKSRKITLESFCRTSSSRIFLI